MASPVLRLHIAGSRGAYTVSAEAGESKTSDTLGDLPDKPQNPQLLQEAILRTTGSLRDRAPIPERLINAELTAAAATPLRGLALADRRLDPNPGHRLSAVRLAVSAGNIQAYKEAFELALRDKGELQIKLFTDDAPPASVVEGAWQK
jgi:hypothetical protein